MSTNPRIAVLLAVLCLPALAQNPTSPGAMSPPQSESTQNNPPAAAPDVAQALDQKVENLTISGVELATALADFGHQVGIQITLDEDAIDVLPWGRQTKLKDISVSHASLREALPQILGPLGLAYQIRPSGVVVVPTGPLTRLSRRATWEELKLLRQASDTPYSPQNFGEFKIQYRITAKVDAPKLLNEQMEKAGDGNVAQILETATGSLGWIWFAEDDHIVVRTQQAQIANQLSRRISGKYTNVPISQILLDLADKADINIHFEPGLMLKLPSSAQSYSLSTSSSSVRQALELMAADVGLTYDVHADGISIKAAETSQNAPSSRGPYAIKLVIPSKDNSFSYELLLREDELPADFAEHSHEIKERAIKSLMEELAPDPKIRSGGDKK